MALVVVRNLTYILYTEKKKLPKPSNVKQWKTGKKNLNNLKTLQA